MGAWFVCPVEASGAHETRVAIARAQFARHQLPEPTLLRTANHVVLASAAINNALPTVYQDGADFIAVAGTLFYKGEVGIGGLKGLLAAASVPFTAWDDVAGHFAALVYKDGQLSAFGDYFGAFQIFTAEAGRMLSTSFLTLAHCLPRLTPHVQAVYEYAFNSVALGNDTIFREITLLDPRLHLRLEPAALAGATMLKKLLPVDEDQRPEALQLAEHAQRLLNLTVPIAKAYGDNVQCPLSGGYDSRLVLAMLRQVGIKPYVYVYGDKDGEEVALAKSIGDQEGFKVHYFDKTNYRTITPDEFPSLVDHDFNMIDGLPTDSSLFDNGGNAVARMQRQAGGAITASGGSGEVFRNFFYIGRGRYSLRDVAYSFYSQFDPANASAEFDEHVYTRTIEAKLSAGLDGEHGSFDRRMIDQLYPAVRSRSFFGREISVVGRYGAYFMPFLEMPVVRAALRLPLDWKEHGRFEAKLIAAIDPVLAAYPSSYGHNFIDGPDTRTQLTNSLTLYRPPGLRRLSYRVKGRLLGHDDPFGGLLGEEFLGRVIDLDFPAMRRFFSIDSIGDASLLRRVAALEYAFAQFSSKVDLTL